MQKLVYVLTCVLLSISAWAQPRVVEGTITDQNNAPVVGASISVKGTIVGTQTGNPGSFKISVPAGSNTLVISYVGFMPQEISIDGKQKIAVSLNPNTTTTNEVVVV